jgi:hypothetical protein
MTPEQYCQEKTAKKWLQLLLQLSIFIPIQAARYYRFVCLLPRGR